MKSRKLKPALIKYEIRNIIGNPFTLFFGIVFPVLMLFIITTSLKEQVPAGMVAEANTQSFITLSLIIPMAVILLGYSADYSQELEKDIPIRMRLFGFHQGTMMLAKVIAQILALTMGMAIYTIISYSFLELQIPTLSSAFCLIICIYLIGTALFGLAHGIAGIFKKFGPTYAIVMILHFGIMILCGMMGMKTNQFPQFLQSIVALLPMSYISQDFINFWTGGSYNFVPMIQAFLFLTAVSGILILYSNYRSRRVL